MHPSLGKATAKSGLKNADTSSEPVCAAGDACSRAKRVSFSRGHAEDVQEEVFYAYAWDRTPPVLPLHRRCLRCVAVRRYSYGD